MKNTNKLKAILRIAGIIALAAIIGFSFAACGGDDTTSGTAPTITTASLPNGVVGTAYSQTLTATGDTPITWSLESGTLPAGLNLLGSGAISGIPTTAGTSTFTVKAANSAGSDTKALSITITTTGGSGLAAPTGLGATALSSTEIRLTWNAVPGAAGYNVYQSSSSSSGFTLGTTSTTNSVINNNLPPNTTFYYKVAAYSANGTEGAMSSVVSATTLPTSGSGVEKSITITGLPATYQYGAIGLYTAGTSLADVANERGAVAGSSNEFPGVSAVSGSVTYPLYGPDDNRWTGSGTYDVIWLYNSASTGDLKLYRVNSVAFTSATTTVAFNRFIEITGSGNNMTYSLDGIWEDDSGERITVSGSTGVLSAFGTLSALGQDAVNKSYWVLGGQIFRNLTNTGALTWSGQIFNYFHNTSTPNVADGTAWSNCTITMSSNGQTITVVFTWSYKGSSGTDTFTYTRGNYSLDGIWGNDSGLRITVNSSTGVLSAFGTLDTLGQDAVNKGYWVIGDQILRNLTNTGALTWSGQIFNYFHNISTPNVADGTAWSNCTITMSANGQTITVVFTWSYKGSSGTETFTYTRKQ